MAAHALAQSEEGVRPISTTTRVAVYKKGSNTTFRTLRSRPDTTHSYIPVPARRVDYRLLRPTVFQPLVRWVPDLRAERRLDVRRPRRAEKGNQGAEKGIESVKTGASDAKVVDLTEREPAHN